LHSREPTQKMSASGSARAISESPKPRRCSLLSPHSMRRNRSARTASLLQKIDHQVTRDRERADRLRKRTVPGNHDAPLAHEVERKFRERAIANGWQVHRAGWPDFALTTAGRIVLVEVKGTNDRLRPQQKTLFSALEMAGVVVRVWWEQRPSKLMPWREFRRITVRNALVARKRKRMLILKSSSDPSPPAPAPCCSR